MPEGNDPMGYRALDQQISREMRCAINHRKATQQNQRLAVDASRTYMVANPLNHAEAPIDVRRTRPSSTSASICSSASYAPSSAGSAKPDPVLLAKLDSLERTLAEERAGRVAVQHELARLTKLLEARVASHSQQ